MFFIMGISEGRKDFDFSQMVICSSCGAYGRYMVFMTYTFLSLFFIPTFRWNRRYFVQMSCCGRIYELNSEVGKRIARGEEVEIRPEDLIGAGYSGGFGGPDAYSQEDWSRSGWNRDNWDVHADRNPVKTCSNCGYSTNEDFEYCPKCGRKF